jgi:hypothetical protein
MSRFPSEWDWYEDVTLPPPMDLVPVLDWMAERINETWNWIEAVRRHEIPYHDYLQSDWWQDVRSQRLGWAGRRCEYHEWKTGKRCRAVTGLDVHHLTYDRLGEEDWRTDLIVLCRRHHYQIHRTPDG